MYDKSIRYNNQDHNRMGCIPSQNDKDNQNRQRIISAKFAPILSPLQLSIIKLREIHGKQQINTLNEQIHALCALYIDYEQFKRMFPILKRNYSQMAIRQLFKLFSRDQDKMSRGDLLDGLVLFHQGNSNVMSRTIFWIYSNGPPQKSLEKRIMSQIQYKCFLEDNRAFQLQHANVKSMSGQLFKEQSISYSAFSKLFQLYDYLQIKQLVQWKGLGMESQLAHTISTNIPILRKNGDPVYVLEYQWYLGWKKYMEKTYKVEIIVEDDKDITMSQFKESRNNKSIIHRETKDKQARSDLRQKGDNCNRPVEIKNNSLQGYYPNELKRDLVQFRDYILIPEFIWKMLQGIYRGGPVYKRTFPQIYSLSVIQVYVDKNSSFIPQKINDNLNIGITGKDESKTLRAMLEEDKKMDSLRENFRDNNFVCYYRNSGRENWQLINNLDEDIVRYLSHHRTYICFMHKDQIKGFQARYNSQIMKNVRYIKNRVENYGSSLKLPIDDVMAKGSVIGLVDNECVIVQIQDRQENYQRKRLQIQFLKKHNTSQIPNQSVVQPFAGMQNLGNTCYMNAVVQCLIRTPNLGNFLAKQTYHREEHQQLLLDIIYEIFQRSRTTKQVISTSGFKKVVQNHFPFFKGFSQQDAQQFLICILSKISDELKQKPSLAFDVQKSVVSSRLKQSKLKDKNSMVQSVEYNDTFVSNLMQGQQLNRMSKPNNGQNSRNYLGQQNSQTKGKAILSASSQGNQQKNRDLKFFSGAIEVQTSCTKCLKRKSNNQESFFTYSLSLPEHKNKQYYFTYIPQVSRKSMLDQHPSPIKSAYEPVRFGITLPNQVTLGQARGDMAKLIGIPQKNLYFAPVFNGEWMRGFSDEDMTKQMNFFANYNMSLVCYQINYQDTPRYVDFYRKELAKKSIKVQVRHRYYNQKNQTFKSFFTPLLVEVDEYTKWKDIEKDIQSTIDNFLDKQYLRDQSLAKSNRGQGDNNKAGKTQEFIDSEETGRHRKESFIQKTSKFQHSLERKPSQHQIQTNLNDKDRMNSEIKTKRKDVNTGTNINLPSYDKRDQWKKSIFSSGTFSEEDGLLLNQIKSNNPALNPLNIINKSLKSQLDVNPKVDKPYKIRLISKSDYSEDSCLICRDKFETLIKKDRGFFKKSFFSRSPCQGCVFSTDRPLFSDKEALYKAQNAIIVIDWQDHYAFKISSKFHSSYQQAKQNTAARVDKLEEVLSENMNHQEFIQIRCDYEGCKGKEIIRTQRLKISPNIFIIHLKRFRYDGNCLVKLMNPVQYPTELKIQNQNYLLYGVIIHNGTGMSGHYYCYVLHEGSWFKCDDQRVVPAVGNQYYDPKAYILFYKKADFEVSLIHLSFDLLITITILIQYHLKRSLGILVVLSSSFDADLNKIIFKFHQETIIELGQMQHSYTSNYQQSSYQSNTGRGNQGNPNAVLINSGLTDREGSKSVARRIMDTYDRDKNGVIDSIEVVPMIVDAYKSFQQGFSHHHELIFKVISRYSIEMAMAELPFRISKISARNTSLQRFETQKMIHHPNYVNFAILSSDRYQLQIDDRGVTIVNFCKQSLQLIFQYKLQKWHDSLVTSFLQQCFYLFTEQQTPFLEIRSHLPTNTS